MIRTLIIIFFTLVILVSIFFFLNGGNNKRLEKTNNTRINLKDSLLIDFTIRQWIKDDFNWFEKSRMGNSHTDPHISVENIFYSSDSLKLISFIIIQRDTTTVNRALPYYEGDTNKFYFDGRVIIGIRSNKCDIWQLFHLDLLIPNTFRNRQELLLLLNKFYFQDLKEKYISDKDNVLVKINCVISDSCFWNCPLWHKGLRVNGLYNFQIDNKNNIIQYPFIQYSKEIEVLFNCK